MPMHDYLRRRDELRVEAVALIDAAETRNEAPGEREQGRLDAIKAEVDQLERRMANQAMIDELERQAPGRTVSGDAAFERELRGFRLTRLLASSFDTAVDAGREREICAETARRAGRSSEGFTVPFAALVPERRVLTVTGGGTPGAALVPTDHLASEFIDALRPMTVVGRLGGRTLTGLRGDVAIPKRSSRAPAPAWFLENGSIATGDQAFAAVTGSPKHLGVITEFSRRLLLQSSPEVEALTREHLLAELGSGLDSAALKGSGSAPVPRGITATVGIATRNTTAPAWADILGAVAEIEQSNVPGSLAWALNPHVRALLRATPRDGTNGGEGFLADDAAMAGLPVGVTTLLAGEPGTPGVAGELILADFSQLLIGLWGGLEILVNPYESVAYGKGNVSVRAIADADVMVRHPEAFLHWSAIALGA